MRRNRLPTRIESRRAGLVLAVALTLVVAHVPVLSVVLYPVRLFTTWVHEMSHGVAALLVGGSLDELVIRADGSGLAVHSGIAARLSRGFVASAGYLGCALFGAAIVASQVSRAASRWVLGGLGCVVLVSVLLWVRNPFGIAACAGLGIGLLAAAHRFADVWQPLVLSWLGAVTALNGLTDIRALYGLSGPTDARTMSELFLLPPWFWATCWLAVAVIALFLAVRTRFAVARRQRRAAPSSLRASW